MLFFVSFKTSKLKLEAVFTRRQLGRSRSGHEVTLIGQRHFRERQGASRRFVLQEPAASGLLIYLREPDVHTVAQFAGQSLFITQPIRRQAHALETESAATKLRPIPPIFSRSSWFWPLGETSAQRRPCAHEFFQIEGRGSPSPFLANSLNAAK